MTAFRSWLSRHSTSLGTAAAVFFAVVLPRLAALGDFPWLDDGYHAFIAQYIQHGYALGRGFPADITGFKLFESLFFWVWQLPGNALAWLRLADLCAAAIAGWLFCRLMLAESGNRLFGLLLAFAGLCGLNLPGAVQSGFKHSFFPAFACLFGALALARRDTNGAWLAAGGLTALGVLFRETFFPFALLGLASLLVQRKFKAFWRYALGGALGGLAVTALVALMRGQIASIFEFYFKYGRIYGPEEGRRWQKFVENGGRALALFSPLLAVFGVALAGGRMVAARGRLCFWLACAILPLAEPLLKIGFLYHFTVSLPGICGFCACVFHNLRPGKLRRSELGLTACAALCMFCLLAPQFAKTQVTLQTLANWPAQGWPAALADQSTTLAAVRAAAGLAPHGSASSTGFAYFIFPASQMLPPEAGLGDLSRAWIYCGYDAAKFRAMLDRNPPDVVLIAHTDADHSAIFARELTAIFASHPDYRLEKVIPVESAKNYGWLGYSIYRREPQARN